MVSSVSTRRFWIYRHRVFGILRLPTGVEGGGRKEVTYDVWTMQYIEDLSMTKSRWGRI